MSLAATIDFLESYDDASILSELKRLAELSSRGTVTKQQIEQSGRVSFSLIVRRFGSLRVALTLAGLNHTRFTKSTVPEVLSILVELWTKTLQQEGRPPQRTDLRRYEAGISGDTVIRHFGTWNKALYAAAASVSSGIEEVTDHGMVADVDRKRQSLSLRKRFLVFKRDSFACRLCGASGRGVPIEIDHIVPFSRGGGDDLSNLQTLCFGCNRGKRDTLELQSQ